MTNKYFGGVVRKNGVAEAVDDDLKNVVLEAVKKADEQDGRAACGRCHHRDLQYLPPLQQIYRRDHAVGTGKGRGRRRTVWQRFFTTW